MTRWLDKPSMDSDEIIDLVIERSQRFFSRYALSLIHILTLPTTPYV